MYGIWMTAGPGGGDAASDSEGTRENRSGTADDYRSQLSIPPPHEATDHNETHPQSLLGVPHQTSENIDIVDESLHDPFPHLPSFSSFCRIAVTGLFLHLSRERSPPDPTITNDLDEHPV